MLASDLKICISGVKAHPDAGYGGAFAMADGKIVWDYDAAHEFTTVNGIAAEGGAFSRRPTILDGMVYTMSGYSQGMAGNVLLAFSVQ